jgi:hypothetical protein
MRMDQQAQQMPAGAPVTGVRYTPGIVRERSSIVVVILSMVTCGVYWFYWMYKITAEIRDATGDDTLNPGMDLLLNVITCSMWGLYTEYRHVQRVHNVLVHYDPHHKDQGQTIMILNIVAIAGAWLGGATGIAAIIATYMVQEEHNKLARVA